jgi:hypothetical protein
MTINSDNFKELTPIADLQTTVDIQQYILQQEPAFVEVEPEKPPKYDLVEYYFTQDEIDNIEYFIARKTKFLWSIAVFLNPIFFGSLYFLKYVIYGDRYNPKRKRIKKQIAMAQSTIKLPNIPN